MQRPIFARPNRAPTSLSLDIVTTQHGSCPACHHFHDSTPLNLHFSRDRSFQNDLRCSHCGHVWMALGGSGPRESLMSQWTIASAVRRISNRLLHRRSQSPDVATDVVAGLRSSSFIGTSIGSPAVTNVTHEHPPASFMHQDRDGVADETTTDVGEGPGPTVDEFQFSEEATNVASVQRSFSFIRISVENPELTSQNQDDHASSSHHDSDRDHNEMINVTEQVQHPATEDQRAPQSALRVQFPTPTVRSKKLKTSRLRRNTIQRLKSWLQRVPRFGRGRSRRRPSLDTVRSVQSRKSSENAPKYCDQCTARHTKIRDRKTAQAQAQLPCGCALDCLCRQQRGLRTSGVPSHSLGRFLADPRAPGRESARPSERGSADHGRSSNQTNEELAGLGDWTGGPDDARGGRELNGLVFTIATTTESAPSTTPPETYEGPPLLRVDTNGSFREEERGPDSAIDMTTPAVE
jgi:hypothetical protein